MNCEEEECKYFDESKFNYNCKMFNYKEDCDHIRSLKTNKEPVAASPLQCGVMPAPIKDQCVCCAGKEHVGKYGDTGIDVCEDCYRNGNLLKWLSANNGAEA